MKKLVLIVALFAAPTAVSAEVLLPSQTQAPQCADGEVFDQQSQRCVPANES